MNISILSVFPELYQPFLATSLVGRAQEKKLIAIELASFFSYVAPKERIDAPTFGHGAGMLIKPNVVERAIQDREKIHGKAFKIFFSPQGKKLDQNLLKTIFEKTTRMGGHLMLLPARYEGMDARVEQEYADELVSIGDFVLMGGDLPAMVLLEGLLRLIPQVVGKEESVAHESFSGPFVDYPEYTEPVVWHGKEVPEIVRSGNHEAMRVWRLRQAALKTVYQHFSWLRSTPVDQEQKKLVQEILPAHYSILMHDDVLIGPKERKPGTTSVTSVDIHDIARSSATYGIKNYFIVTPLIDQQKIVNTLMDFWMNGVGIDYNPVRHEAIKRLRVAPSINDALREIEEKEGSKPLLIATSARKVEGGNHITFFDQEEVWRHKRPVVFIFGTGQGLTPELVGRCDYILPPIVGFSSFNHLSVRSAVAVILDRWLGANYTRIT